MFCFWWFHPFCFVFFPSLWIYPPVVCVVADFPIGFLVDVQTADDEVISVS